MNHLRHQVELITLACLQGSDHAPVRLEMVLPLPLPRPSIPPPLSSQFLLIGLQPLRSTRQVMLSALQLRGCLSMTLFLVLVASSTWTPPCSNAHCTKYGHGAAAGTQGKLTAWLKAPQVAPQPGASQALSSSEPANHLESQPSTEKLALSQLQSSKPASAGSLVSGDASDSINPARQKLITSGGTAGSKGKKARTAGQQSLTRFVQQTSICPTQLEPAAASPSGTTPASQPPLPPPAEPTQRTLQQSSPHQHDGPASSTAAAKAAWSRIQESAKPPLCGGHQEPCVIREVKKKGPNKGMMLSKCSGCPSGGPEPLLQ